MWISQKHLAFNKSEVKSKKSMCSTLKEEKLILCYVLKTGMEGYCSTIVHTYKTKLSNQASYLNIACLGGTSIP